MNKSPKVIDNRYVIDRLIGVGGVAFVYKAWDTMLHKFVAVKKIHEDYAKDAKFVDMFRQEAVNTAKLDNENIVRVVNFIKSKGDYYMIMDYVNGIDLEYLIKKCAKNNITIPPEVSVYIVSEIIKALDYAHNMRDEIKGEPLNIVHRDISPGNIMLYYDGRIKLTDFGIAKAGEADSEDEPAAGKVSYMSPEQALCGGVDSRSDLFSSGLVLYEMLTSEKPYKGKTNIEKWKKAKSADVDFKKVKSVAGAEDILPVLKRVLSRNPDERYQSAAEMFIELKKYLSSIGNSADINKRYAKFITSVLKEEIEASEKELQKDPGIKYEIPEPGPDEEKQVLPADLPEESDESPEPEARSGFGLFFKVGAAVFIFAVVLFAFFDTQRQDSLLGNIFSSLVDREETEIRIDTIPSGASVEVLNEFGYDIVRKMNIKGESPLYLSGVEAGNYMLRAEKKGFRPISRRMTVIGRGENASVSIANARMTGDLYILPFEVDISVRSRPSGATLYINNRNVGTTPYTGVLESGIYSFRLVRSGYEPLGVRDPEAGGMSYLRGMCVLDVSAPVSGQTNVDMRFWEVGEVISDGIRQINLLGYLKRN